MAHGMDKLNCATHSCGEPRVVQVSSSMPARYGSNDRDGLGPQAWLALARKQAPRARTCVSCRAPRGPAPPSPSRACSPPPSGLARLARGRASRAGALACSASAPSLCCPTSAAGGAPRFVNAPRTRVACIKKSQLGPLQPHKKEAWALTCTYFVFESTCIC